MAYKMLDMYLLVMYNVHVMAFLLQVFYFYSTANQHVRQGVPT